MESSECRQPHRDVMNGSLIMEATDSSNVIQEYVVTFIFLKDTTVADVLRDVNDKFQAVGLRLVIPLDECCFEVRGNAHSGAAASRGQSSIDRGCVRPIGTNEMGSSLIHGSERIYDSPVVRQLYCGNSSHDREQRVDFVVVRRNGSTVSARSVTSHHQVADVPPPRTISSLANNASLSQRLLQRKPLLGLPKEALKYIDPSSLSIDAARVDGVAIDDEQTSPDALSRVRKMVENEKKLVVAFGQDLHDKRHRSARGKHWSLLMKRQPSMEAFFKAVEDEKSAYENLTMEIERFTSRELADKEVERGALESTALYLRQCILEKKKRVEMQNAARSEIERLEKVLGDRRATKGRGQDNISVDTHDDYRQHLKESPSSTGNSSCSSSLGKKRAPNMPSSSRTEKASSPTRSNRSVYSMSTAPSCMFRSCRSPSVQDTYNRRVESDATSSSRSFKMYERAALSEARYQ
uniref:WGS project CAEQ00000000 data, annotated contig 983 n=1 Tax=Trypanosoma congolense (strain IL3000) TaxID=1068625 RepID=F9WK33_TRYCI|nr:unnamed protein product [Trypanosoma congolense IL3000]